MLNFEHLMQLLGSTEAWLEVLVLLAVLVLSYVLVRLAGRRASPDSVLFGRSPISGLLFPLLALAGVYACQAAWTSHHSPLSLLRFAIPVLMSLAIIRLMARVLRAVFPRSDFALRIERTVSWLAWLGAVLWIAGFLPWMLTELETIRISFGKTKVDLRTLLEGALSSIMVLVLALWTSATIEQKLLSHAVDDLSMRKVAANALRALLLMMGLLFALSAVGVDLMALSVLGGALGMGLGFGLQKLAANYVSGFVILLERSLRIGDHVKVDGFEGQVKDIKTRYTLIRAPNGRESVVPNETLIAQRVENLSLQDSNMLLTSTVTVGYEADPRQVQALLTQAAGSCPRILSNPAPNALLMNLAADGMEFQVGYWINDPDNGQNNARSAVNIAILDALRQAGVEIPFPQREVRIRRDPGDPVLEKRT
ncbi:MAG: mechanosensitive ion channel [Alphaproteobacteria bacterium]|nr:mechanosensitive ion channel [Alphaproteobacteria bacterium]